MRDARFCVVTEGGVGEGAVGGNGVGVVRLSLTCVHTRLPISILVWTPALESSRITVSTCALSSWGLALSLV